MTTTRFSLRSTVLGSPDPRALASFYRALLDWEVIEEADDWVVVKPGGNRDATGLSFQREDRHVPPTWPAGEGDQQMQLHLDIAVADLDAESARALALGAPLAEFQPEDGLRVHLDPDGHVFCLFAD